MVFDQATMQPAVALTAAARLLADERPIAARARALFGLLRQVVAFDDGRLLWWNSADDPLAARQEAYSVEQRSQPWDEAFTSETWQRRVIHRALVAGLDLYGAPVLWDGRVWGMLELRAGHALVSPAEQQFLDALLPLLGAALAAADAPASDTAPLAAQPGGDLSPGQAALIRTLRHTFEAPLALAELLETLLRQALDATGAEAGLIFRVDHERGELEAQVYEGYPREPFNRDAYGELRRRQSWEIGLAGQVARTGRAALLRDVQRDRDYTTGVPEIRARLAVPIGGDQGAGGQAAQAVLVLDSPRSAAFGESELLYAQALCNIAAAPLRRALWYHQALETSMQLGQVFASIPNGLALLDRQGRVLRCNPAWYETWNTMPTDSERAFHVPWDLVPLLLPRLDDPLRLTEFGADGQSGPAESRVTTIILREPHQELLLLATPTRDSIGQLTGQLWVVSDVTREREADRLKSEFISIVSHELRTPLTSILGYTELLMLRPFTPDEQKDFVKTIYDQANHLSQIIEDLLGMSRIEAGKVTLNQWTASLRPIVNEVSSQLNAHLTSGHRHRIVIDMPQRLPPVLVDRDKVKQILVNLLTNAVKYSPRGGEITLTVEDLLDPPADHPDGAFLLIGVKDQGIGIAPEDRERIWERFYRVDNSNTRRIGGTGLGLAITRALVELHGGRIWLESQVGQGSTFYFTLPLATEGSAQQTMTDER